MRTNATGLLACLLLFAACLSAAGIEGKVVDPTGASIAGAEVSAVTPTGIAARTVTSDSGAFRLEAPDGPELQVSVTAPGFAPQSLKPEAVSRVQLAIAPQTESVQ